MFGNGFSRHAIVNAHVLRARLDSEPDPKLSDAARDLVDVQRWFRGPEWRHSHQGKYTYMCDALDNLEFEDTVCFFAMLAKRDGWKPYAGPDYMLEADYTNECRAGGAVGLADAYARAHATDGVTIHVQNSDDDPTRVDFHIQDPVANAWADRHGSLDGGTWECADREDFVYDSTYWHAGLFEELDKEGFRFDFSVYGEPDEHDIAIAQHASECEDCQDDWHKAEEHLETLDASESEEHVS